MGFINTEFLINEGIKIRKCHYGCLINIAFVRSTYIKIIKSVKYILFF